MDYACETVGTINTEREVQGVCIPVQYMYMYNKHSTQLLATGLDYTCEHVV